MLKILLTFNLTFIHAGLLKINLLDIIVDLRLLN